MFDNGSEFKGNFTPFLKNFGIKSVLTTIKNPQANVPVEQLHQVILNILATKDIDNKVLDHIDPWGETLVSIAWMIKDSHKHTIMATPGQSIFERYMLFNPASGIDWRVINAAKQRQLDIDNTIENRSRVTHDCAIGNKVYLEMSGI